MNLYEIAQQILSLADEETCEITDFEQLDKLQMEREQKLENIALWIKNLAAEEAALTAEKQAFEKRIKRVKTLKEKLMRYLSEILNGETFKTSKVICKFRKSQSVKVDNVLALPKEYIRYQNPEADKNAIKKAINEGKEVAGAELVTTLNLHIA
ncbi:MAG: siphovirus Gp157 family protein [Ruminiclostridium sp.]|nr:siphovirus Gp157 family protein [Ruminiclostridium sp.]